MTQYQLRIPPSMKIEDLISEVSISVFESVKRELDSSEVPYDSYSALFEPLKGTIAAFVKAFDHCGKYEICTEGIEQSSWRNPEDQIFILNLWGGPENLVDLLAVKALQPLRGFLDPVAAEALSRRVRSTIDRTLSNYLCLNPACGYHEVCETSKPIEVWSHQMR